MSSFALLRSNGSASIIVERVDLKGSALAVPSARIPVQHRSLL